MGSGSAPQSHENGSFGGGGQPDHNQENRLRGQNSGNDSYANTSNTNPQIDEQQIRQQISDFETQQNNYLAQNGGYVNTDNLPILSGYWEKIDALNKQLERHGNPEHKQLSQRAAWMS